MTFCSMPPALTEAPETGLSSSSTTMPVTVKFARLRTTGGTVTTRSLAVLRSTGTWFRPKSGAVALNWYFWPSGKARIAYLPSCPIVSESSRRYDP